MIEVEVKIPIENIEKIKQKLLETGFIYQKTAIHGHYKAEEEKAWYNNYKDFM